MTDLGTLLEHAPVLDLTVVEGLRDLQRAGKPGFFRNMVDLFLEDTRKGVDRIEAALTAGDANVIHRTAHSLKSSCAVMGASRLSLLCARLETFGRDADLTDAPSALSELRRELTRAEEALRREAAR